MLCLNNYKKQRGIFTLVTALLLTLLMSIVMLTVAKSSSSEQRISANQIEATQAFTAAQAGLQYGIRYLGANKTTIVKDTNNDGYIDTYSNSNINNVTLTNGGSYTITYSNPTQNNLNLIKVQAVGKSVSGNVTKTVSQLVQYYSSGVTYTGNEALVAKNIISLSGNISVTNTVTNKTIESGSIVNSTGNVSLTTSLGSTSNPNNTPTSGVEMNNSALNSATADQLFQNFFGNTKANIKANATVLNSGGAADISAVVNNTAGQIIWIDGDANIASNVTIGTQSQPVILIVKGDLNLSGTSTINGFVYGMKNMNISGTVNMNGAFAAAGYFNGSGNVNVKYDNTVISNLNSTWGGYAKVAGSWRDF